MKNIIVASHRRSGTHITIDAIANNFKGYNNDYVNIDRLIPGHKEPLTLQELKDELSKGNRLIKTHMLPIPDMYFADTETIAYVNTVFQESDIIYVVRNCFDVMVSLYHYIRGYNTAMKEVDFNTFISMPSEFDKLPNNGRLHFWAQHYNSWNSSRFSNKLLAISFEEWQNDFEGTVKKIGSKFGLRRNFFIKNVLMANNNAGLLAYIKKVFSPQPVKITSVQFRKGKTGEGKKYFDTLPPTGLDNDTLQLINKLGYA